MAILSVANRLFPGGNAMSKLLSFLHDIRYVLLFYIVGDILTTYVAITGGYGFESNPFLKSIYLTYILKLIFLCWLSILYIRTLERPILWDFTRHTIVLIGIFATVNNLIVIYYGYSPIQLVI
jgi:hypothetical protein